MPTFTVTARGSTGDSASTSLVVNSSTGKIYSVSPGSGNPLQTAVAILKPGDILNIQPGIYQGFACGSIPGNSTFGVISGTAAAPITIRKDPSAPVGSVIINLRNQSTQDGIDLEGCSYITLDGIVLDPTLGTGGAIGHSGIRIAPLNNGPNCTGNTVQNCTVNKAFLFGIYTSHQDNVTIQNNVCSNMTGTGPGQGHGIYVANSCVNPKVINNKAFGNPENGIQLNADVTQGGNGLILNAVLTGNIIHDNGAFGGGAFNLGGVQNSIIENNLLYNNHSSGIVLSVLDASGGSINNLVCNNTVIMASDSRWCVNINGSSTGPGSGNSTGNVLFNNILYNNNTASNRGSIEIDSGSRTGFVSDYNILDNKLSTDAGSTGITLAAWRTATGQDMHSINSTPAALFVNPTSDFHELATSPSVDHGIATLSSKPAPTLDLDGKTRPLGAAYDMGCYER